MQGKLKLFTGFRLWSQIIHEPLKQYEDTKIHEHAKRTTIAICGDDIRFMFGDSPVGSIAVYASDDFSTICLKKSNEKCSTKPRKNKERLYYLIINQAIFNQLTEITLMVVKDSFAKKYKIPMCRK